MALREQFRDAADILDTYQFDINHNAESGNEVRRNVSRTAPTSGVGFVRQQGDASPRMLNFSGTILKQSQHDAMMDYFAACSNRTVFFTYFTGVEYEVLILDFNPIPTPTLRNPRDPSIPNHYYKYTLVMEIIA